MRKECKISMPFYKIAYAVSFVILLSLVRGVYYSFEVGVALETPMAILTAVFCADTYVMEIVTKRSDIWRLYPLKKRLHAIHLRMILQGLFLLLLTAAGYGLFFLFQKPRVSGVTSISEAAQFWIFLASSLATIIFWGIFSNTIACIFRNAWFGIGASLILWILTNSTLGDHYLGKWNVFSYSFRNVENSSDLSWICGKIVCICLGITAIAILPKIIEKRG